jgi:integrase
MTKAVHLTVEGIARTKLPAKGMKWLSDTDGGRGAGRLYARISASGARDFYFRYTTSTGERVARPLGQFARTPEPGKLTLIQAREEVSRLRAKLNSEPDRDLRAAEKRDDQARQEAEAARVAIEIERAKTIEAKERYTVAALADTYCRHLKKLGKPSSRDVESIFRNHLHGTEWAPRIAAELTAKEVAALLRRVVDAGHGRTAAKFRSYLRAAYALALNAELDASVSSDFLPFKVQSNPVASTGSLSHYNNAREHTLTEQELRAYWRRLDELRSGHVRAALKLALLLGGQRVAQLLRLRRADVDLQGGKLRLFDGKGRRKKPRVHELPLTEEAAVILRPMVKRAEGLGCDWIFTSNGTVPIVPDTLAATVSKIAEEMVKGHESRFSFIPSDIRRTIETLFASKGISRDIRAQIQSHGLSGVQVRHYDRHDYRDEKRRVLQFLATLLHHTHDTKVVPLHSQVA